MPKGNITYDFFQFCLKLAESTVPLSHGHALCREQLKLIEKCQTLLPIGHILLVLGVALSTKGCRVRVDSGIISGDSRCLRFLICSKVLEIDVP